MTPCIASGYANPAASPAATALRRGIGLDEPAAGPL